MKDQVAQVAQLFEKKKYKKALLILNKINKKNPDHVSIHYTAACYFYEKRYAQASLYYIKALKLASDDKQKMEVLSNLAVTQVHLGEEEKAIKYYMDLLAFDGSIANAVHRDSLCRLASETNNHQVIFDYAPKLLGWHEYARSGLYFLLKANLLTPGNDQDVDLYLKKLHGEVLNYDSNHALLFFELVSSSKNSIYIKNLADVVEKKFSREKWFVKFKSEQSNQVKAKPNSAKMPTEQVVGGNKKLVQQVKDLLAHCESIGSWFHPSLRIIEDNGSLSVKVFEQTGESQKLIIIPYQGLPVISDFDFSLDKNSQLIATPIAQPINPDAIKTMALLQDIYNSADKIKDWKQTFPLIALRDYIELIEKLCSAKPNISKIQDFYQSLQAKQLDELTINSFLGSRKMLFSQEELQDHGIVSQNAEETVLLSVIDFLNHRISSNPYLIKGGTLNVSGPADKLSHELFVHYNNYDPLMTYLLYGFVDLEAPYAYSIPVEITALDGRKVQVLDSTSCIKEEEASDEIKHLKEYLPVASTLADGTVVIDKLMIPNTDESHLLREVLSIVLKSINANQSNLRAAAIEQEVIHLEKQLILKNRTYWNEVEKLLEAYRADCTDAQSIAFADTEKLISFYKSHYQKYSAKFAISTF